MNFAHLRSFHAVAREGSFTRAAGALGVSQPTLSTQVKALEEEYGVALFTRRGRGVEPTELGRALFDLTRRLFSLEEEAAELLAAAHELTTGELRIGADSPFHVVPFLAAFRKRYPSLHVSLAIGNAEEQLEDLLRHNTDIAVLADLTPDARLEVIPCGRHPIVLFVPRTHSWVGRKSVALGEIARETVVLREAASRTRRIFEATLARAGVTPREVIEIESREAVREAVASGLGIGAVSAAEFGHDERLAAVPVRGARMETSEFVVCLKERRNLRIVAAFLASVRKEFGCRAPA
jgi:aminoethylphosphonate catabolism LysR family transcriptional regulator